MERPFLSAILLCSGSSNRFGSDKLFLKLLGKTVLQRSIEAFEKSDTIDEIIVVCKENSADRIRKLIKKMRAKKVSSVVFGGETRFLSVREGLKAVSEKSDFVAIHDGARPMISAECIKRVAEDAFKYGGAIASVPVKDTIKVSFGGFIESTPERSRLYSAQTPQIFKTVEFKEAIEKEENIFLTDDSLVFERGGKRVFLSKGENTNIKITTPEDKEIALQIIKKGAKK